MLHLYVHIIFFQVSISTMKLFTGWVHKRLKTSLARWRHCCHHHVLKYCLTLKSVYAKRWKCWEKNQLNWQKRKWLHWCNKDLPQSNLNHAEENGSRWVHYICSTFYVFPNNCIQLRVYASSCVFQYRTAFFTPLYSLTSPSSSPTTKTPPLTYASRTIQSLFNETASSSPVDDYTKDNNTINLYTGSNTDHWKRANVADRRLYEAVQFLSTILENNGWLPITWIATYSRECLHHSKRKHSCRVYYYWGQFFHLYSWIAISSTWNDTCEPMTLSFIFWLHNCEFI